MAKQKKNQQKLQNQSKPIKEPKRTYAGFLASLIAIILGFIAQMVMAVIVYPRLPEQIPSGWAGSATPYNTIPSWTVFLLFPSGQIGMLILIMFARRDEQGRRILDAGNAVFLILLSALFTVLQASAFRLH
ncbi:MAG: hypothetical protein QHH26_05505 [Armatimonadota bacterium]|nr:hypothetical protein [Armatimonadota bacterium]